MNQLPKKKANLLKAPMKPLALTVVLGLTLFFGNSLVLFAQPAPTSTAADQGAAPKGEENIVCQAHMQVFMNGEFIRYMDWMEQNFQNKSSTSSLLDSALARYKEFRTAAYNEYSRFFPHQGALQLTEGLEPGACRKLMESVLSDARRLLESKARSTSSVKKTTALISKYQEINGKLRTLNGNFLKMKSYLDTFADKLPCYIRKSCNK